MIKIKQHLIAVLYLGISILSGCDDNTSFVGDILTPDRDIITAYSDTFRIAASTVQRDSLFAKTTAGLLGEYYDPLYGRLKADFLCQFYCEDNYQFQETPYENKIDSIYMVFDYFVTGDPNSPFQFQIFPVIKPLDKAFYTNVNPEDYCDLNNLWGSQVSTAAAGTIIDSAQVAGEYLYIRRIEITMPQELGQMIYEETIKNPASFKTQQAFNEFFPGIYLTTGYGSGCMFDIQRSGIFIDYKSVKESDTGEDSIIYRSERFITTKEVIQLNRFESSDTEQLLADNENYTYIKTPAGIYTRLVFPSQEIKSIIEDRIINNAMFSIKNMPNENWPYALEPPPHLLLLPEDSLTSFFHNRSVDNNITSYISVTWNSVLEQPETPATTNKGYSPSNRTYYFSNISALLSYHLSASPDEDLRLLLVPVTRRTNTNSNGDYYTTEISNYLAASGLKIRKDNDMMTVSIVTSKYNNK